MVKEKSTLISYHLKGFIKSGSYLNYRNMISLSLSQFPPNYGVFPYFLITDGYNEFVQFPIQFLVEDNGEEHALSLSPARQFRKMRIDLRKESSKKTKEPLMRTRAKWLG